MVIMMDNEYELFPPKLLEDLKYDVEALKKKLSEPDSAIQDLLVEVEDLKTQLKELNNVFTEALQEIKEEDSIKLLNSLQSKVETVNTQNETIARGMIAISDKLEDFMKKQKVSEPGVSKVHIHESSNSVPRMAPSPGDIPPPPTTGPSIPPPPAIKPKRQGIFK